MKLAGLLALFVVSMMLTVACVYATRSPNSEPPQSTKVTTATITVLLSAADIYANPVGRGFSPPHWIVAEVTIWAYHRNHQSWFRSQSNGIISGIASAEPSVPAHRFQT